LCCVFFVCLFSFFLCWLSNRSWWCWLCVQTYYGRHEPAWMAPPVPYFVDSPYGGTFREAHQFPVLPQEHFFSAGYPAPYGEPMARIPRSSSAMPAFGHYGESPFLERPGPPRSSGAIPAYPYPPEVPYHDSPLSHGPTRSSSSIPSFREPRESRPKQHKVGPVSVRLSAPPHLQTISS
jgi:hypothetical protein